MATKNYYQLHISEQNSYGHAVLRLHLLEEDREMTEWHTADCELTFQSNITDCEGKRANDDVPARSLSAIRPKGIYCTGWYTGKVEIRLDHIDNATAVFKVLARANKVAQEFNYHYRYVDDELAPLLAALQRMGWHEWVNENGQAYDNGKHHRYDLK